MGYLSRDQGNESIEREIASVLDQMETIGVMDERYPIMIGHLEKLNDIKTKNRSQINLDTLALIGGNLLGIILIIAYEQKHVITSKGLSQIIRPR
jgi:hypothetical protein